MIVYIDSIKFASNTHHTLRQTSAQCMLAVTKEHGKFYSQIIDNYDVTNFTHFVDAIICQAFQVANESFPVSTPIVHSNLLEELSQ